MAKQGENSEVTIARTTARQAIIVAVIGAVVSLATIFKDAIIPKPSVKEVEQAIEQKTKSIEEEQSQNKEILNEAVANKEKVTLYVELPVGSVITSILDHAKFAKEVKDNAAFDPQKSIWAPADGREITNSKYFEITGNKYLPDLRGQFLRGYNHFLSDAYEPEKYQNGNDPGPRKTIQEHSYQADALGQHAHKSATVGSRQLESFGGNKRSRTLNGGKNLRDSTYVTGEAETRPRNVAVYFYIKINERNL